MSILDKFNSFEVKTSDRLSKDDLAFLERREQDYKHTLAVYSEVYDIFVREMTGKDKKWLEENKYTSFIIGNFDVPKKIAHLNSDYISGIYGYFERKYSVTLERNIQPERDRYLYYSPSEGGNPLELNYTVYEYNKVIDDIINQLGGLSFEDKMFKELKDKIWKSAYNHYNDEWGIKIKGNVLTYLPNYGYVRKGYGSKYHVSDGNTSFVRDVLEAVSYDRYSCKLVIPGSDVLVSFWRIELTEEQVKNGIELYGSQLKKIKFFKNGRIDFTFENAEETRNFARKWCSYTLV